MQQLFESTVKAEEIDSLGHLNVRFYLSRVESAARVLLGQLGLDRDTLKSRGAALQRIDTYSQFKREQFEGAHLTVHGGLLESTTHEARGYFEIRNPEKDELAGLFVTGTALVDKASRERLEMPPGVAGINEMYGVRLPEYAVPRSLSLDKPSTAVTLAQLEEMVTDDPIPGMMSGRREGVIEADDCDEQGRLRQDVEMMFVLHRAIMAEAAARGEDVKHGPPVQYTDEGHRFSWAMMETRSVEFARPRSGDRVVFMGADVGLGEKTRQSRRWMFVADTGELLSIHDSVGVAIDLDARKAIQIPADLRAQIERTYLPELA